MWFLWRMARRCWLLLRMEIFKPVSSLVEPPLTSIAGLSPKFKLLPIPDSIAARVQTVYRRVTINYANLRSGPIVTLAPTAIVVGRVYKSPKMSTPQAIFRQCFYDHLDELKETPGKHPKWQLVDPADHGPWEWMDFTATPLPPQKK
jgi:hypothetical protein